MGKKLQRPLWNQGRDRKREVRSCNKTLTLENATITGIGNERCLFNSECEGLRIVLKGSNRIVNNEEVGMEFRSATTICGPGTLDIRTKKKKLFCLYMFHLPLKIAR